jgi:hypothetical protein
MAADLHLLAPALGGEVSRNQVLAPALGHSRQDRSPSVRLDPCAPGGVLVHCFGSGNPSAEKDRIRQILGLDRLQPVQCPTIPPTPRPENEEHKARALALWHQARHPKGTLIEVYLQGRGLILPQRGAGEAVRSLARGNKKFRFTKRAKLSRAGRDDAPSRFRSRHSASFSSVPGAAIVGSPQ